MKIIYLIVFIFLFTMGSAASVEKAPLSDKTKLTVEEQKDRAFEAFKEILNISTSSTDRMQALPKMIDKYNEIIDNYPDVPLAQESCLRLTEIYLNEHSPPAFNKAEMLYSKFTNRYPKSILRGIVEETIAKKYNKYAKWNSLLNFTVPILDRYAVNSGKASPALIFLNAEANYSLGNMKDAEESYKLVIKLFPDATQSQWAEKRLEQIKEKP